MQRDFGEWRSPWAGGVGGWGGEGGEGLSDLLKQEAYLEHLWTVCDDGASRLHPPPSGNRLAGSQCSYPACIDYQCTDWYSRSHTIYWQYFNSILSCEERACTKRDLSGSLLHLFRNKIPHGNFESNQPFSMLFSITDFMEKRKKPSPSTIFITWEFLERKPSKSSI